MKTRFNRRAEDYTVNILAVSLAIAVTMCIVLGVWCVEYKHEIKLLRELQEAKDQVIDEQNSSILKLLDCIKYMRGEM